MTEEHESKNQVSKDEADLEKSIDDHNQKMELLRNFSQNRSLKEMKSLMSVFT